MLLNWNMPVIGLFQVSSWSLRRLKKNPDKRNKEPVALIQNHSRWRRSPDTTKPRDV